MTDKTPFTQEQAEACYKLGKQVYENRISRIEAIAELVDKHGMKRGSAGPYIQAFLSMMKGGELNWSVNQGYVRYFFKNISHDEEQIKISLECLEKHIEYYARKKKGGGNVPSLRNLYNEYSQKIGSSKKL